MNISEANWMNTAKMYTICYAEPFKMNYKYNNSIIIYYTIKSLICTFKMFRNRFSPSFAPHSHRSCKWLKNPMYRHDKLSVIIQLYQTECCVRVVSVLWQLTLWYKETVLRERSEGGGVLPEKSDRVWPASLTKNIGYPFYDHCSWHSCPKQSL